MDGEKMLTRSGRMAGTQAHIYKTYKLATEQDFGFPSNIISLLLSMSFLLTLEDTIAINLTYQSKINLNSS